MSGDAISEDSTSGDWPDIAGRMVASRHVLPVRIYFEDTDFSGFVYHGSYIRFMERARSDFVRLAGIGHTALGDGDHGEPLSFAVRRITIDYLKPARIDDLVEVETSVADVGGARVGLRQRVTRDGITLAEAMVTVVLIGGDGRARRIPDTIRRQLAFD